MTQSSSSHNNEERPQQNALRDFFQPIRRMGCLTFVIAVIFGSRGLLAWMDWIRELTNERTGIISSVPYSSPIDAVIGLSFCLGAIVLLWFTFTIPDLRRNYRGMGIAWALIMVSGGSQRLLAVLFEMSSHQLTLIVNPLYGSGALLFVGWLWWHHRTKPSPRP